MFSLIAESLFFPGDPDFPAWFLANEKFQGILDDVETRLSRIDSESKTFFVLLIVVVIVILMVIVVFVVIIISIVIIVVACQVVSFLGLRLVL